MKDFNDIYVAIDSKGNLRFSQFIDGNEEIVGNSTIKKELLLFADWDIKGYAERVAEFYDAAPHTFPLGDYDFDAFMHKVNDFASDLFSEDLIYGTLTTKALNNLIIRDDTSDLFPITASNQIIACLEEILDLHFIATVLLDDITSGNEIDLTTEPYCELTTAKFTQQFFLETKLKRRYLFDSLSDYYRFILMLFLDAKPNIAWCHCCGKYFYPATAKATKYCDRIIENGKTCKQIGPHLKRKIDAQNDTVLLAYKRTYQKMYKRLERSTDSLHPLAKGLTQSGFFEWNDKAVEARDLYLKGKLTAEDALAIIETE